MQSFYIKQSKGSLSGEGQARLQLLAKQKELIDLQQKKIELELEQTKVQLVSSATVFVPPHPLPQRVLVHFYTHGCSAAV